MKKNVLLAFLVSSQIIFAQSQRLVLVEEFTQASCMPCAMQNPAFDSLMENNKAKAVVVKYQTSFPGADVMNAQNAADVANKCSRYLVGYVPHAWLDGTSPGAPAYVTQNLINSKYAVPSPFTIQVSHFLNAALDSVFTTVQITASQNVTMTNPKLRVALIEKTIDFTGAPNNPGNNGEKIFKHVMRKFFPNESGTQLQTSWTNGQKKIISFGEPIPSYIYKITELAVVAWIQDDANLNVKQAGYSDTAAAGPPTLAPVANFSADVATTCDGIVNFKDLSAVFPKTWHWNFGDGQTSTLKNPIHKYLSNGTYNVKLIVTNNNGTDSVLKTSVVTVNFTGTAPSGVNGTRCGPGVVNLSATPTGSGSLAWYNSNGTQVNSGNTYSPSITNTTNFYVQEMIANPITKVGPIDSAMGKGTFTLSSSTYLPYLHGLYFDVLKECTLVSVKVYASSTANRTIHVLDYKGNVIHTNTSLISAGENRVMLNFPMIGGTKYFIRFAKGTNMNLYCNFNNSTWPYNNGIISITGTDNNSPLYYFYFYDFETKLNACASLATTVTGTTASVLPVITANGNILTANSGMTAYQWYLNGVAINGATSMNYTTTQGGSYTVQITDGNGCSATSNPYLLTSINSLSSVIGNMNVYPSPFTDNASIDVNLVESGTIELAIVNILGEEVAEIYSGQMNAGERRFNVNASSLNSGIYFIKLSSVNKSVYKKVILAR